VTLPREPPHPPEYDAAQPLPLALELPSASAPPPREPTLRRPRRRGEGRRWLLRLLVGAAVLASAAFGITSWLLPWYLRRQCIDEAATRGITLSVDRAELAREGFRLIGIRVSAADVPGVRGQAPDVLVRTSGLKPETLTVRGAELAIDGAWSNVMAAFAKWKASARDPQAEASTPATVVLEGAHVTWRGLVGDAQIDAGDLQLVAGWAARDPEVHMRSDRVHVTVPAGVLGPWRVDVDRVPGKVAPGEALPRTGSSRMRLALDPGVPDSSTLLIVGDEEHATSVDVSIPRSPLARLGIPASIVGQNAGALQVEAVARYAVLGPNRADASAKGGVYGIAAPGIPRRMDVSWEGAASGSPRTGLDVKNARLAVGPLVGALSGMLKVFDDGCRLDLAWTAGPVPCTAFDAPLGAGAPFDVAYQIRKLAEATGVAGITGSVRARANLTFDSRDLSSTRVDFQPEVTCRMAPLTQ
jgi:hypothetical protein